MPSTDPHHMVQAISDKQSIQRIQIINLETRLPGQRKQYPGKGLKINIYRCRCIMYRWRRMQWKSGGGWRWLVLHKSKAGGDSRMVHDVMKALCCPKLLSQQPCLLRRESYSAPSRRLRVRVRFCNIAGFSFSFSRHWRQRRRRRSERGWLWLANNIEKRNPPGLLLSFHPGDHIHHAFFPRRTGNGNIRSHHHHRSAARRSRDRVAKQGFLC